MAVPLGAGGWLYAALALGLGGLFLNKAWVLLKTPSDRDLARDLFKYSISYMMLLSAGMVIDSLPITQGMLSAASSTLQTWVATLLI